MLIKRRTRVVVETRQVWAISRQGMPDRYWCSACAREVRMITPEEAATILRLSPRIIYSWIEAAKVHYTEQPEGLLLVCLDSLPAN